MTKIVPAAPSVRDRARNAIWAIQGYGLVLITFLSFFPRWFHREEYLFFALLLVALATAWWEARPIWTRTPIDLPLVLFVAWVLLTIPHATDPAYSLAEWRKLATQVLVFYWALLVLRTQDDQAMTRRIFAALMLGTVLSCVYAISDFVAQEGTWRDRYVRAGAPYSDYNWLSTYMVMVIPMMVAAAVVFPALWQRVGYASAVLLAVLSQIISYTRAGWLGVVAEGIAVGLISRRRWLAIGTLVGCLVVAVSLSALSQAGYQQDTVGLRTLQVRLVLWEKAIQETLAHPLIGVGYGDSTFLKRYGVHPVTGEPHGLHNLFLMVALGSGLPALGLLLWILLGAVISLIQKATRVSQKACRLVMLAVAIMIVGFAVRNLFGYMFAGSIAYLFWILVAVGLLRTRTGSQSEQLLEER